jgi:uncharacterized protein (DUF433 family)
MSTIEKPPIAPADGHSKPLIQKTPGVCGGAACIRGTRIMVWLLVDLKRQGASEQEILEGYPALTADDLVAAWEYDRLYPEEINQEIANQEKDDYGVGACENVGVDLRNTLSSTSSTVSAGLCCRSRARC